MDTPIADTKGLVNQLRATMPIRLEPLAVGGQKAGLVIVDEVNGFATRLAPLDEFVNKLPKEGGVLIFCASYNGAPPDNATQFVKWLRGDLPKAIADVLAHDGPAVLDVVTARQELSMPPTITAEQVKGFSLWILRAVMSGRGDEVLDLAKTNLLPR